jgi:tetratricopeptide (TPR) repeat protein
MQTPTVVLLAAFAACLSACATVPVSGADAISRLEQQQRAEPGSAPVTRALGIAYYQADRYADARRTLDAATRLDPTDGATALYLGLTAEAQNDLPTARTAYSSYLRFGRTSRVRAQLQSRLASLARKELAADARSAVAHEATIGADDASPRTIAVMPLRFTGRDSTLQPLERGFSDLLITDLARSPELVLVERSRLQALLDELSLGQRGVTDAATSARAGRLLRAGRVVQGALFEVPTVSGDQVLRADAAVVSVPTSRIEGTAQGTELLDQVFTLEKKIALDLFQQLGITLTAAQRNEIEQRPTRSLAAFLAYSHGLVLEDAGRFDDANRYFNEAIRLDPGFGAAQQKLAESRSLSMAATPATVEASMQGSAEERVATAAGQGRAVGDPSSAATVGGTIKTVTDGLNVSTAGVATGGASVGTPLPLPPGKDPVAAGTNTENGGATGRVVFTIPRPKP